MIIIASGERRIICDFVVMLQTLIETVRLILWMGFYGHPNK